MSRAYGFSYVEVLVATLLLALALVPALESLVAGMRGANAHAMATEEHFLVVGRLEDVLARSFDVLDDEAVALGDPTALSSWSDPVATPRRLLVFLSRYDGDDADTDGDPFTGGDAGLLWVRVELENTERALETLTTP